MPVLSHLVNGTVYDIYGNILVSATVILTHSSIIPTLTATTGSDGKYIINLSGLDSQWSQGDSISLTASKTNEGRKTEITTIQGVGGQTINITLEESSDFTYETMTSNLNRYPLVLNILRHYDGKEITRLRPLPVLTKDPRAEFVVSDEDTSSDPVYYGYVDRFGSWYILERNTTNGTYRYAKGTSDYATNWTNRTSLTYQHFFDAF